MLVQLRYSPVLLGWSINVRLRKHGEKGTITPVAPLITIGYNPLTKLVEHPSSSETKTGVLEDGRAFPLCHQTLEAWILNQLPTTYKHNYKKTNPSFQPLAMVTTYSSWLNIQIQSPQPAQPLPSPPSLPPAPPRSPFSPSEAQRPAVQRPEGAAQMRPRGVGAGRQHAAVRLDPEGLASEFRSRRGKKEKKKGKKEEKKTPAAAPPKKKPKMDGSSC